MNDLMLFLNIERWVANDMKNRDVFAVRPSNTTESGQFARPISRYKGTYAVVDSSIAVSRIRGV